MVLTPEGRVLAHGDPEQVGRYASDARSLALLRRPAEERLMMAPGDIIDAAAPITVGGVLVGWARVGLKTDLLNRHLTELMWNGVLYAGVAISLGVVLAVAVAGALTRRLGGLVQATRQFGAGVPGVHADVGGADEVSALSAAFNVMVGQIAKANRELRESEATMRWLIGSLPAAVLVYGEDTAVRYSNETARRMLGLKEEQILGKRVSDPCWRFVREDGSAMSSEEHPARQVVATGRPLSGLLVGVLRGEEPEPYWVYVNAYPEMDADGALRQVIVSFVDITDRKRAENEIKRLYEELTHRVAALEEANRELEGFSYSVSHELRIPLRAIDGFVAILLDEHGAELCEDARRRLDVVRQSASRMGTQIDGLLDFIRLSRRDMRKTTVDMNLLANEVCRGALSEDSGRRIGLHLGELPRAYADRVLIREALDHLVRNAVKFTAGREGARIEVGGAAGEGENIYYVKDNGVGFNMLYSDKLFAIFLRLHSPEEHAGPGVGLAIVKRIIDRHGGRVWAEGKVGEGAAFYFSLPNEG